MSGGVHNTGNYVLGQMVYMENALGICSGLFRVRLNFV